MVVVDMGEDKRGRKGCRTRIRNGGAVYQPDEMSGETDPGFAWRAIILMALPRTGFG